MLCGGLHETWAQVEHRLHIAVFLSGLSGGGAQRRSLLLARGFVERGCAVDVVVVRAEGPFRAAVPAGARLFALESYVSFAGHPQLQGTVGDE